MNFLASPGQLILDSLPSSPSWPFLDLKNFDPQDVMFVVRTLLLVGEERWPGFGSLARGFAKTTRGGRDEEGASTVHLIDL